MAQAVAVLCEHVPAAGSQVLGIVQPGAPGVGHVAQQQIGQTVSRDLAIIGKGEKSPGLHVSKRVLLQRAEIDPQFDQVLSRTPR